MKHKPFEPIVVNIVVNKTPDAPAERRAVVGYWLTKHFAYTQTYVPESETRRFGNNYWNVTHILTGTVARNMVGDRAAALRTAIMFETLGVKDNKSLWDFTGITPEEGCPVEEIKKIADLSRWITNEGLI